MKIAPLLASLLASSFFVSAQVTITSQDMFHEVGQYYKYYVNVSDVSVGGRLGGKGGPQSWDFTQGPKDAVWQFDIVPTEDGGNGGDFPNAKIAERLTREDGSRLWLYLEQVRGMGRVVYGYYNGNEIIVPGSEEVEFEGGSLFDNASVPFTAPIVDFPDPIRYEDTWETSTSYENQLLGIPARFVENTTFKVDAYGVILLPNLGFKDCLRVNSLNAIDVQVDFELNGNYQSFGVQYVRTYYWLTDDRGIAAQITSTGGASPPPDSLSLAATFARMFETNHSEGEADNSPNAVEDLKITSGQNRFLLSWSIAPNATSYTVEHTSTPWDPSSWVELGQTTSNFMIDAIVPDVVMRFYRIISVNNPE